ncbi:MAG: hypothetical protein ACT4P7_15265 [Gemmatimonadaceae bacterium]
MTESGDGPDKKPTTTAAWKRWLKRIVLGLIILAIPLGAFVWYKFFRQVDQPASITGTPEANFLHGSIGTESRAGIPYWIIVALPRIFDDFLPGPGGYASLGLPWPEGSELPVGFSKKTIGFDRVGFNCALCHATQYRTRPDTSRVIVAAGGSNTADIEGLLNFFSRAASDSRFSADVILTEIDRTYRLGWIDRMLYKFAFIPIVKKRLAQQGREFAWSSARPRWGPGRDAPMNLTKFNFLRLPPDSSIDNTDFPSIWSLKSRVQQGRTWPPTDTASVEGDWTKLTVAPADAMLMNLDGATTSFRSVLFDSALGLQAEDSPFFRRRMQDLEDWLMNLAPPPYPFPIDAVLRDQGSLLFEQHCASCHASGRQNRLGTVIPLAEIRTDSARVNAWTKEAADSANRAVRNELGIQRTPMVKPAPGYIAMQLEGIWLRGPYLHNGSVPTLRALLEPEERRPTEFYRGYDVLDRYNGGFISRRCAADEHPNPAFVPSQGTQWGCMPNQEGWLYRTIERGNGNGGHQFGVRLTDAEKAALVEYLKSL